MEYTLTYDYAELTLNGTKIFGNVENVVADREKCIVRS